MGKSTAFNSKGETYEFEEPPLPALASPKPFDLRPGAPMDPRYLDPKVFAERCMTAALHEEDPDVVLEHIIHMTRVRDDRIRSEMRREAYEHPIRTIPSPPPTHAPANPTQAMGALMQGLEVFAKAVVAEERRVIARWLRTLGATSQVSSGDGFNVLAGAIERGEHDP